MTDQAQEYLHRLRIDPVFFVTELWRELELDQHHPIREIDEDLIWFAFTGWDMSDPDRPDPIVTEQGRVAPKYPKRGVLAPRFYGKTRLVICASSLWDFYVHPEFTIEDVSKSKTFSKSTVSEIRECINRVWFLQHLRPNPNKRHRDQEDRFDIGPSIRTKDPSMVAHGIDGQITGTHSHALKADDIETPGNTRTLDARERLNATTREFTEISSYGHSEVVVIGTFHHEESVYLKLAERGYEFRTYPIAAPQQDDKILGLAPYIKQRLDDGRIAYTENEHYEDNPLFPHRFNRDLIIRKMAEGKTNFAMQNMLLSNLADPNRYPLRLRDFIIFPVNLEKAPLTISWGVTTAGGRSTIREDLQCLGFEGDALHGPIKYDEQWQAYTRSVMKIDPAGRGEDAVGYACIAYLNGYFWVKALGEIEGGYDDLTLTKLATIARTTRTDTVLVEDNYGQGMFGKLITPFLQRQFTKDWTCSVELRNSRGQKELRILQTVEPPMNTHRIVIDEKAIQCNAFQYQLTRLTSQRGALAHDDVLDAFAGAVAELMDPLDIDPEQGRARAKHEQQQQEVEESLRLIGMDTPEPNYFHHV